MADLGFGNMLNWMFHEVCDAIPNRQAQAMALAGDELWISCPVAFAKPLVGSLHTFLTGITRKCEREKAYADYRAGHPELPRFHVINAGDLMRMPRALVDHDFWCALHQGDADCSCTWPIEYGEISYA